MLPLQKGTYVKSKVDTVAKNIGGVPAARVQISPKEFKAAVSGTVFFCWRKLVI
jgi:hypothetical protein